MIDFSITQLKLLMFDYKRALEINNRDEILKQYPHLLHGICYALYNKFIRQTMNNEYVDVIRWFNNVNNNDIITSKLYWNYTLNHSNNVKKCLEPRLKWLQNYINEQERMM